MGVESFPEGCCRSVARSCPALCDPMDCSMPGSSVLHCFLEFVQIHVHWVSDAIQPSYPLSSPSPPAFNLSQFLDDGDLIYHKCIRHGLSFLMGRAESEDKMWLTVERLWKSASKSASLEHRFTWNFIAKFWWSFSFPSLAKYYGAGFSGAQMVKNPPASAGDTGSIPGLERSCREGNGNLLQCSCLGNPMDRGAWQMAVHGWQCQTRSQTRLRS